jgi:hypothetical protein
MTERQDLNMLDTLAKQPAAKSSLMSRYAIDDDGRSRVKSNLIMKVTRANYTQVRLVFSAHVGI